MRFLLALLGIFIVCAVLVVSAKSPDRVTGDVVAAAAARPYATADPSDATRVSPEAAHGRLAQGDRVDRTRRVVSGLAIPIEDAALPTDPDLLPNAPREFRGGWHEGIDFPAPSGTAVHAVAAGTIVRIDGAFTDWSPEQQEAALSEAVQLGYTPSATLDRIRGRQVWVDHGRGIVSRYAHLSDVADLAIGARVERGQIIGAVGSSGYPEGGPHLHLEIRLGTSYLGDSLDGDALTAAIAAAFDSR
jgi:murein DD-endopeptidase MepM/ murein hydrolase activator NlpD